MMLNPSSEFEGKRGKRHCIVGKETRKPWYLGLGKKERINYAAYLKAALGSKRQNQ